MSIDDLIKKDSSFSESGFISKVDNTYVMLLTAIMTGNMDRVKHKISEDIYNKYKSYVDDLSSKNEKQMYGEPNVKSTSIISINENDDSYIIDVELISRYLDYIIDTNTHNMVSGNNDTRVEKSHILTFTKKKNAKKEGAVRKCPGCGASIDANSSGICSYCGTPYDTATYDWVLTKIA